MAFRNLLKKGKLCCRDGRFGHAQSGAEFEVASLERRGKDLPQTITTDY
jgi:hypothetical protein